MKEEIEKEKQEKLDKQKEKSKLMHKHWNNFCRTLSKDNYEKAFELKQELVDDGYKDENDLKLKVNTSDIYQK